MVLTEREWPYYEGVSLADVLGLCRMLANSDKSGETIYSTFARINAEIDRYSGAELDLVDESPAATLEPSSYWKVSTTELVVFSRVLKIGPVRPEESLPLFYASALNEGFYEALLGRVESELARRPHADVQAAVDAISAEMAPKKGRKWF